MAFAGLNYWAVLVAGVAGWLTGAVWYGVLCKQWQAALEKTEAELKANQGKATFYIPFIIALVAALIMAWVLAGVVGHLGPGQVTIKNAVISGAFLWFGFVLTTISVNYSFGGRKPLLIVIDAGHWLAELVVMGVVIGAMGV